jgi:hypothetical protein
LREAAYGTRGGIIGHVLRDGAVMTTASLLIGVFLAVGLIQVLRGSDML